MAISTFRASCRKSYRGVTCDETFTGAEGAKALAAHMKAAHGPRTVHGSKPAWINAKPYPHKPAGPTKGGIEAVEARIAEGAYVWPRGGYMNPTEKPAAEVED